MSDVARRIALGLAYDGSGFAGWQSQASGDTLQDALERALAAIACVEIRVVAAGRTDAGVHALAQVMHARLPRSDRRTPFYPVEKLRRDWNDRLPSDISILRVEEASPKFHARHDAIARSYIYQIATRKSAFTKRHVWWIKDLLDVAAMEAAAPLIERLTQPLPFGKSALAQTRKGASYPLHPGYISREEAGAVTPKKKIMKNKPKDDERRTPNS